MDRDVLPQRLLKAVESGRVNEAQARAVFQRGEEAVVFAMLELARQLAVARGRGSETPSAPSSTIPPYAKPAAKGRRKRPGARLGHPGHRRPAPERVDQRREHRLPRCPDCGGRLQRTGDTRTRYTEDIPEAITPVVTEHTVHRDWCPQCRNRVEPKVPDALPGATLGHRTVVLSGWLHYGLGNTLAQIVEVFNHHLQLKVTPGGLVAMWQRLAEALRPWYEQLQTEGLQSAVLHADETGWRVNGRTHWLWCFAGRDLTYYQIDASCGAPALAKFFQEQFAGTLVSDFWSAYDALAVGDRQRCWVHLLRELKTVEARGGATADWPALARRVRRLFGDALRWHASRAKLPQEPYDLGVVRLENRALALQDHPWQNADARRLAARLARYGTQLFTFLWYDDVPSDNNPAERSIRPAVVMRKNSYSNRSERGAATQAILMSLYRTLQQRGHDPLATLVAALRHYTTSGRLPPLPSRDPPSR
jgi:transposase